MKRPTHVTWFIAALLGLAALTLSAPRPAAAAGPVQLRQVLSGLSTPDYLTSARDGSNRLFIVEQAGVIKVLQPGAGQPTVFLDIHTKVLFGGERGLLGLAFHPDFPSNRRFFVNYTRQQDGATVIAEYRASTVDSDVADSAETVILVVAQPFANHNGGMIEFGPDGFLYIGMGDGGSGNDPDNRAQNLNDLLGKMLRIDVDHPAGYSSPPDNPFAGATPGRDEIFAYGLRNPFRFSFDRQTGHLYAGDVGQGEAEEIDIITKGGNYGWRIWEGSSCTDNDPGLCSTSGFVLPIAEYGHTGGRCAVIGGYVYRGAAGTLPRGSYVYGDLCTGEIFILENGVPSRLLDSNLSIASFGEDEAGEIYVVGLGGTVHRIGAPVACAFTLSPASKAFSSRGTLSARVRISTGTGCAWTAVSSASWIAITRNTTGSGSGSVTYSIAQNTGRARSGTITIGGKVFTITQAGRARPGGNPNPGHPRF